MANSVLRNTLAVLLLSMATPMAFADDLTDQAKALLDQGKTVAAFSLLESQESARAGDLNFDLLFGIAAVDVGQNTRAVFALERVLAQQPDNARARAEMARAYLALGETTAAKQEFEQVQKQGVPAEFSDKIDRFLDAVDRVETVTKPTLRGYLEGTLGYDSNVNSATSRTSIAIPGFGGLPFTLADDSRAQDAGFGGLGGGVNLRTPINAELALVGGLSAGLRGNFGESQYDNLNADAYAGLVLTRDKHVFSANAQFNHYELGHDRYRTASGLSGQWQYNHDSHNQLSAFVQYSDLRYPTLSSRDAERWVLGGAMAHAYRGGEVAFASAYWANERPRDGDVPWLGFDGIGLRAGGQLNINPRTVLFANGSLEYRHYGDDDPMFRTTRRDTQYDLTIGVNYVPVRHWTVTPKLGLTYNQSNIELNKYHREAVSVTVRRDF